MWIFPSDHVSSCQGAVHLRDQVIEALQMTVSSEEGTSKTIAGSYFICSPCQELEHTEPEHTEPEHAEPREEPLERSPSMVPTEIPSD